MPETSQNSEELDAASQPQQKEPDRYCWDDPGEWCDCEPEVMRRVLEQRLSVGAWRDEE